LVKNPSSVGIVPVNRFPSKRLFIFIWCW